VIELGSMKLSRIEITNFRCIDRIEVFPKSYTSLIGPNNSGKSAVLRGIELLLNQETPLADEWRQGHEKEPILIEADFDDIQEWERNKQGVSSLVYDNRIRLRMSVNGADEGAGRKKAEVEIECFRPVETIDGWPDDDSWGGLDEQIRKLASDNGINSGTAFKTKANKERVRTLVRERMAERVKTGEAKWTSEGVSIPVALQQALPQAQLIPAIRDAAEDAQPGAKTSFGLLLKSIVMPAVSGSDEYQKLLEAVKNLEKKLKSEGADQLPEVRKLAEELSSRLSDLITAKVSLGLDTPDAEKFIGANTILKLDDGAATRIALQGHGLQRALVFAMLEVLAAQRALSEGRTRRTVLLFEEPELFIHPHLMRRLKEILEKIARRGDWQVIISTHSPFLVDVAEDPCSLVIHQRPDPKASPTVKQLKESPFVGNERLVERERLRAVLDFHPSVCEAFFAKRVVLVEGDTEMAALVRQPDLYRLAGVDPNIQKDTTIVSCDGKWTIIPIARLLRAFGLPIRVIHDQDRKGKTDAELAEEPTHEYHANAKIAEVVGAASVHQIADTFEDVLWDKNAPKSKSDKPYRGWKRVKELCEEKENLDHAPKLRDVVRFAYAAF